MLSLKLKTHQWTSCSLLDPSWYSAAAHIWMLRCSVARWSSRKHVLL